MSTAKRPRKTMARYDGGRGTTRKITRQAAADLGRGLEDTDCRGTKKRSKASKAS